MSVINVCDFGADPTGTQDSFESVQAAAEALHPGDTLLFPAGTYFTSSKPRGSADGYITIRSSNVHVTGGATLKNFNFDVRGSYGEPHDVERTHNGDEAEVPGFSPSPGGYVQFLSAKNSFTADAGRNQGGSVSPASDILYYVQFAEISEIFLAEGDSLSLTQAFLFDEYAPYRSADGTHLVSQVRELNMVSGVVFSDLTFDATETPFFRSIRFRVARDCAVENCSFIAGVNPGRHVMVGDSLRISIRNNISRRSPSPDARGSSWNSFIFGAGSQACSFTDNHVYGDWQAVDFTSFGDEELPESGHLESNWRTTQLITISGNYFTGCHDAITTHPGTFYARINANTVRDSTTGARVRSRNNMISSNTFSTRRYGLVFSSFFNNSLIQGNLLERSTHHPQNQWAGFGFLPTTNEIITDNAIDGVFVVGNRIVDETGMPGALGIHAYHQKLGPNTQAAKLEEIYADNKCSIAFRTNEFNNLRSLIGERINGISVE